MPQAHIELRTRRPGLGEISLPHEISGKSNLVITGARQVGGADNLRLTACSEVLIQGGMFHDPRGVPGDSNHNIILVNCDGVQIIGAMCTSDVPRSDAINSYNSSRVLIEGCQITGRFLSKGDIGRAIAIDGTGRGGANIVVRGMSIPHMTIACGRGIRIENMTVGVIQIGGAYGADRSRSIDGVVLVNVKANELFVDPAVKNVVVDPSCNIARKNFRGNVAVRPVSPGGVLQPATPATRVIATRKVAGSPRPGMRLDEWDQWVPDRPVRPRGEMSF